MNSPNGGTGGSCDDPLQPFEPGAPQTPGCHRRRSPAGRPDQSNGRDDALVSGYGHAADKLTRLWTSFANAKRGVQARPYPPAQPTISEARMAGSIAKPSPSRKAAHGLTWIKAAGQFPLNHIHCHEYIATLAPEARVSQQEQSRCLPSVTVPGRPMLREF